MLFQIQAVYALVLIGGLNPYYAGRCSFSIIDAATEERVQSLNPYYAGRCSFSVLGAEPTRTRLGRLNPYYAGRCSFRVMNMVSTLYS